MLDIPQSIFSGSQKIAYAVHTDSDISVIGSCDEINNDESLEDLSNGNLFDSSYGNDTDLGREAHENISGNISYDDSSSLAGDKSDQSSLEEKSSGSRRNAPLKASESEYAESIDDSYYQTLNEAYNAAANMGGNVDIKLLKNVSERLLINKRIDVTIDLNGNNITAPDNAVNIFQVSSGSLTVTDSTGEGKLLPYDTENYTGCRAVTLAGGKFEFAGGTIAGFKCNNIGGAVSQSGSSEFILCGGIIENCSSATDGGAINAQGTSVLSISEGAIRNCSSNTNGGAIRLSGSVELNIYGGVIENCSSGSGGAVYSYTSSNIT